MSPESWADAGGGEARFPTTLWGQVVRAADPRGAEGRAALDQLVRRYWKPVHAYICRAWPRERERAEDLTQAYFTTFLEKDYLAAVDREKGRFRSFLKASLENFLRTAHRDAGRLKRGGGRARLTLDDLGDIPAGGPDPAHAAAEAFDAAWRSEVLRRGLLAVREDLIARGKGVQWQVFEAVVLPGGDRPGYKEVADRLGLPRTDVTNHLHAVRHKLRQTLRAILLEGLADPRDLDSEWSLVFPGGTVDPRDGATA